MRTLAFSLLASLALLLAASMRADEPAGEPVSTNAAKSRIAADAVNWNNGVAYVYDPSGNIRSIGTDDYFYDAAGRLILGETDGIPRNFEYDAFGNRTRCIQNQGTAQETDCQWGLNTINPANNRMSALTYDAAGNATVFGTHQYSYDGAGMQTRDAEGATAREYIYTADDERIAVYETAPQTWRWTVRDTSSKVLREFTSTGVAGTSNWKWEKDYVWRDGLLLATRQIEPGGSTPVTYHYHLDHLGSPRRITNGQDQVAGVHDYHAFGPRLSGGMNEPSHTRMKYTGHERDADTMSVTALDYMHARYYAPNLGRFLSVDPVLNIDRAMRHPQNWNRYSYVMNNPVNRIDPDGRDVADWLRQMREGLIAADSHLRKGNAALAQVPVARLSGGDRLYGTKFNAGPVKAEVRIDGRIRTDANAKTTVGVRAVGAAGIGGSVVQSAVRVNANMTVAQNGTLLAPSLPEISGDATFGTRANAAKGSLGELTWQGSVPGASLELGVNFQKAGEAVGELGTAISILVQSAAPIKSQNDPDN